MSDTTPNFGYTLPTPFSPIDANIWGDQLNGNLSSQDTYLNAAANTYIGTSAPSTPVLVAGRFWINTTASPWTYAVYDGSNWCTVGMIDPVNHVFIPVGGSESGNVNIQTFTTAGTYTPTAGMVQCVIEVLAGGGGGGGVNEGGAGAWGGAGGGAGEYAKGLFTAVTIGASQAVGVGVGGASAMAGGNSFVGSLITAFGGRGAINTTVGVSVAGALGGTGGSGGSIRAAGSPGSPAILINSGNCVSGLGGSSQYGAGGNAKFYLPTAVGNPGLGYGAGGGGAAQSGSGTTAGGAGSAGIVIITEYL